MFTLSATHSMQIYKKMKKEFRLETDDFLIFKKLNKNGEFNRKIEQSQTDYKKLQEQGKKICPFLQTLQENCQ